MIWVTGLVLLAIATDVLRAAPPLYNILAFFLPNTFASHISFLHEAVRKLVYANFLALSKHFRHQTEVAILGF